ncbi:hypothetical protein KY358_00075 [Candidatus Woesearchaeota archaeon]|nr:hypothetical protein [Candidatus Woesearchaeota archaeon]
MPQSSMPSVEQEQEAPIETVPEKPEEPPLEVESETIETQEIIKIPNDIREIIEKGKARLKSYSCNYKGPDSDLEYIFYVKGNNIRITLPELNTDEQGKFYNTVYLDSEKKAAQAYCMGYSSCEGGTGKVKDLDYSSAYIETPNDWLEKIKETKKIDERQVEGRGSVYLETNAGKMILESYYGFIYRVEEGSKVWAFTDASFNSVKDADVIPSDA